MLLARTTANSGLGEHKPYSSDDLQPGCTTGIIGRGRFLQELLGTWFCGTDNDGDAATAEPRRRGRLDT
jgi:hypothetical protein